MTRVRTPAVVLTGMGLAAFERWTRQTRATSEEKRKRLPGDELVARPMWQATRAISIQAPRDAVWPWLVQMGYPTHRAGWYIPSCSPTLTRFPYTAMSTSPGRSCSKATARAPV